MQKLIAKALADPETDRKPISISAATIRVLGIDAHIVLVAAARLNLPAMLNFDRQGGILVARSAEILKEAGRLRDRLEPVPVVSVRAPTTQKAAPPQPSTGGTPVQPLSLAVETARRDKARKNLRESRTARAHPNYDDGQLD